MYTAKDIRDRITQAPFIPLRVVTSSGEAIEIHHPDLVLVGVRDITIGFASDENPKIYDRQTRVALMYLTALEELPQKAPQGKNGQL